jgi:hypothetical protein
VQERKIAISFFRHFNVKSIEIDGIGIEFHCAGISTTHEKVCTKTFPLLSLYTWLFHEISLIFNSLCLVQLWCAVAEPREVEGGGPGVVDDLL